MRVYTQYERPPATGVDCSVLPDRTRQSEAAATDVNGIVARFRTTGMLPQRSDAFYADVYSMGDYRDAVTQVAAAERRFMQLPAAVRSRFDNDPSAFVDFAMNPGNREELVRMKLLERLPTAPVAPVEPLVL